MFLSIITIEKAMMDAQLTRLDILLGLIAGSEMPTAHDLLPRFLSADFGIQDRDVLEKEIELLTEILKSDDYITEEQEGVRIYYSATQSGVEFFRDGGYVSDFLKKRIADLESEKRSREDYEFKQRQADNYISPRIPVAISCAALLFAIFTFVVNYNANNPSKQIMHLEKRLDSLKAGQ